MFLLRAYKNRTGQFCEECIRLPGCVHGTCGKAFECTCDDGWEGMVCDKRKTHFIFLILMNLSINGAFG